MISIVSRFRHYFHQMKTILNLTDVYVLVSELQDLFTNYCLHVSDVLNVGHSGMDNMLITFHKNSSLKTEKPLSMSGRSSPVNMSGVSETITNSDSKRSNKTSGQPLDLTEYRGLLIEPGVRLHTITNNSKMMIYKSSKSVESKFQKDPKGSKQTTDGLGKLCNFVKQRLLSRQVLSVTMISLNVVEIKFGKRFSEIRTRSYTNDIVSLYISTSNKSIHFWDGVTYARWSKKKDNQCCIVSRDELLDFLDRNASKEDAPDDILNMTELTPNKTDTVTSESVSDNTLDVVIDQLFAKNINIGQKQKTHESTSDQILRMLAKRISDDVHATLLKSMISTKNNPLNDTQTIIDKKLFNMLVEQCNKFLSLELESETEKQSNEFNNMHNDFAKIGDETSEDEGDEPMVTTNIDERQIEIAVCDELTKLVRSTEKKGVVVNDGAYFYLMTKKEQDQVEMYPSFNEAVERWYDEKNETDSAYNECKNIINTAFLNRQYIDFVRNTLNMMKKNGYDIVSPAEKSRMMTQYNVASSPIKLIDILADGKVVFEVEANEAKKQIEIRLDEDVNTTLRSYYNELERKHSRVVKRIF
ncbi:hypothetical protein YASMINEVIRUS_1309 [Yasminevirus sp. GU-2018]|uniref:Uncharacterized protein n=1 Tax=Yasminevirus sp. GU-2018 TaxID=2420051 RepID=A0A5K0U9W1_9VIRU|nr:hypothetical protein YASMINEVIRUS_1309 [Yasminevirus sp. GU-2018]